MGRAVQDRSNTQSVEELPAAEHLLSNRDPILARVIAAQTSRWPTHPTEDPIWGLVRIVMAQQISTQLACRIAERVTSLCPSITSALPGSVLAVSDLRAFGLPERRAQCCVSILRKSDEIRENIRRGETWESALEGIKGIGPWTLSVFHIMILREPDILPLGDIGLERAVANVYGEVADIAKLAEKWRPFRSVACWYLWRTLGNEQLG